MSRFPFKFPNRPFSRAPRRMGSYGSSYGRRSKPKSIPLLWILGAIPVGLVGLELLLRVGLGMTGRSADLAGFGGEPAVVSAYRLSPSLRDGQAIAGLPPGSLKVRSSALMGYELVPNQTSAAFSVNAQGFRDTETIESKKVSGEIRVLLLGGSSAFGTLSSSEDQTIAHQLEAQLNQQVQAQKANPNQFRPDVLPYFADEMDKVLKLPPKIRSGQYRVINAAVPGYLTSNTLSQLSTKLLDYQPDVVVLIDGYSDLLVPSDREAATLGEVEKSLINPAGHFFGSLGQGICDLWNQLYLVKTANAWLFKPNPQSELLADVSSSSGSIVDRFSADGKEIQARIDRRTQALDKISQLTRARKVPLIVGIAPEISQRQKPEPPESDILSRLGDRYPKLIQAQSNQLLEAQKKLSGITPVDLQSAVAEIKQTKPANAFVDAVHLTGAANGAIAQKLVRTIAPLLYVEPKPFQGEQ